MGILKTIASVILLFFSLSCEKVEPFTLIRKEVKFENLKTNGFYYVNDSLSYEIFFLNSNGVYVYFGKFDNVKNMIDLEKQIIEVINIADRKKVAYHYGIFTIQNKDLKIERWLSGTGGTYPVQTLLGIIETDSTIRLTKRIGDYLNANNKKTEITINELYFLENLFLNQIVPINL